MAFSGEYGRRYEQGKYYQAACSLRDIIDQTIKDFVPSTIVNLAIQRWTTASKLAWEYLPLPMDIVDTGTHYMIRLDLPGFDKNKLFVRIENENTLIITGQRLEEDLPSVGTILVKTRPTRIEKRIPLPINLKKDMTREELNRIIKASYHSCFLEITISKSDTYNIEII